EIHPRKQRLQSQINLQGDSFVSSRYSKIRWCLYSGRKRRIVYDRRNHKYTIVTPVWQEICRIPRYNSGKNQGRNKHYWSNNVQHCGTIEGFSKQYCKAYATKAVARCDENQVRSSVFICGCTCKSLSG